MTWNYRMVRKDDYIEIREVYYDDGVPVLVTEDVVGVGGDDTDEVLRDMQHYLAAIAKPVIEYDDIPGGYAESFVAQE